jgi:hypothetical protein
MGYADIWTPALRVKEGLAESKAFGLRIGRINVSKDFTNDYGEIMHLVRSSGMDLVIVRIPSELDDFAAHALCDDYVSIHVDTLMYFVAQSLPHGLITPRLKLERVSSKEIDQALRMIEEIFRGYRNHYSANPSLQSVTATAAYQDWLSASLDTRGTSAYFVVDEEEKRHGMCLLDEMQDSLIEILLAGILEESRNVGHYQEMLKAIQAHAHHSAKSSVAISTQSSNVTAMRAWCRVGFLPTVSMNTFHIQRRETYFNSNGK